MSRVWVVNASPLILLGTIGSIELLPHLCGELIIPQGVAQAIEQGPPCPSASRSSASAIDTATLQ